MAEANPLARLPKVDVVLAHPALAQALAAHPRPLVLAAVRAAIQDLRGRLRAGEAAEGAALAAGTVAREAAVRVAGLARPSLRRVVNATGVVVHTNLGRSLLAPAAARRALGIATAYNNLEYDLAAGRRGSRHQHVTGLLTELTGAEAALVVNNNAAAVLLCLSALAAGREVIVSRGELVEIGGSFRIPDVMAHSGARLKEIGTTNKTHLADYQAALGPETALLLKVHRSNFALVGFTAEVGLGELAPLAREHHLPLMLDLGSGVLLDLAPLGLAGEATVRAVLAEGADLVTISGDKLLGGPQAGIVLGRAELVERLRRHPLSRALRVDKLTLAALEATLELYRDPRRALAEIPTLAMLGTPPALLARRAAALVRRLRGLGIPGLTVSSQAGRGRVGGGALPLAAPATRLVALAWPELGATRLEEGLRRHDPPIIGRLEDDRLLLDVRTLLPGDDRIIAAALAGLAPAAGRKGE